MKKLSILLDKINRFLKPCVEFAIIFCFVLSIVTCFFGKFVFSFAFTICLIYHCFIYLSDEIYELRKSSGTPDENNKSEVIKNETKH